MEITNLQAVLFDLDGTLVNSHEIDRLAFVELLDKELGVKVTEEMFSLYTGSPIPNILMNFTSVERAKELSNSWVEYKTHYKDEMQVFPGVPEMLEKLKQAGLKLAVISSQLYEERVKLYRSLGLEGYFESWLTSDQTEHSKPHPEPVLKTLQRFNVPASQAIMIGDTFNDMEAGRRAGTFIGAAMWGFGDKEKMYSYQPDLVFSQVPELETLSLMAKKNIQFN